LTLFDFPGLITKLKAILLNEKEFFEQVSQILMKIMQNEPFNDGERILITVYNCKEEVPENQEDLRAKLKLQGVCNMPKDGNTSLGSQPLQVITEEQSAAQNLTQ
jgi:hypothetical protein